MRHTSAALFLSGIAGLLTLISPLQAQLNPIGNNGNVLRPGVPLSGPGAGGIGVVTGPNGVQRPATGPHGPAHSGGGSRGPGAGNGRSRGGYNNGYNTGGYGGPVYVPYPVNGSGYGVHNPAPGEYDPIFGGYNPGVYNGDYDPSNYDPQAPTPTVIINQNFQPEVIHPQMMDYSHVRLPAPGPQPEPTGAATGGPSINGDTPMIMIAMKDHTIYPALAYWVQGDTLNYVMVGGAVNHASLTAVDRDLTLKLNSERRVDFHLPPDGATPTK